MANLSKRSILIFTTIFILIVAVIFFSVSTSYAGYDAATANNNHTGFYLGAESGYDIPTGPDEDGYNLGVGGSLKLGYQFIRYLALELGMNLAFGNINLNENTPTGTQTTEGLWLLMQLPFLNLKPIIPLGVRNNLYFIIGVAMNGFENQTTNQSPNTVILSTGGGFNLGMGYEGYVTNHISLGGEILYHNFSNTKFQVNSGAGNVDVTTPYSINMSFTAMNFVFLYHF